MQWTLTGKRNSRSHRATAPVMQAFPPDQCHIRDTGSSAIEMYAAQLKTDIQLASDFRGDDSDLCGPFSEMLNRTRR